MKHGNVVEVKDCAFDEESKEYCIVFERMEWTLQSRIDDEINKPGKPHFPEWKIWIYFY